jgi:hypothetical protein
MRFLSTAQRRVMANFTSVAIAASPCSIEITIYSSRSAFRQSTVLGGTGRGWSGRTAKSQDFCIIETALIEFAFFDADF